MSVAVKSCPHCAQPSLASSGFCPNCGSSIADVQPASKLAVPSQNFFNIPPFLLQAQNRRRRHLEEHGGTGIVWIGFIITSVPILMSRSSNIATAIWGAGLLVVILGFWRMRHDGHTLSRAGLATNLMAVAALAGVSIGLATTRDSQGSHSILAPVASATATTTPDWMAATSAASSAPDGSGGTVPMFRVLAAHTGEYPGPGPVGHPYRKWRFDTGGSVRSSPSIAGGLVFFGSKNGFLYAVDVATGQSKWQFDLGGYPVRSSPAVVNRTVFVGGGYSLYAIDATTGEERWKFPMRYAGESSPTVADGFVYIASKESLVYAVDAADGTEKWHFATEGLIFSSPAVAHGLVLIGSDDGYLYAIDAKTGQTKWKFTTGGEVYSSPAVVGDRVFVSSKGGSTFAVDVVTGKEIWHSSVGGESSPAVVGGRVYIGGDDGALSALDANTGSLLWLFATGKPVTSSPAVSGGVIYVSSGQTLFAVDAATGIERWHYPTGQTIGTSPIVLDSVVYIGDESGYLYAVGGDGVTEAATPASS